MDTPNVGYSPSGMGSGNQMECNNTIEPWKRSTEWKTNRPGSAHTLRDCHLHETSRMNKSRDADHQRAVAGDWGRPEQGVSSHGSMGFFGERGNGLESVVAMGAELCEYSKNHRSVYILWMGELSAMWITTVIKLLIPYGRGWQTSYVSILPWFTVLSSPQGAGGGWFKRSPMILFQITCSPSVIDGYVTPGVSR